MLESLEVYRPRRTMPSRRSTRSLRTNQAKLGQSSRFSRLLRTLTRLANDSQDFINSEHFTTERIAYPRAIVEELIGMLDASRERYPVEMQRFDEMSVGFLERI